MLLRGLSYLYVALRLGLLGILALAGLVWFWSAVAQSSRLTVSRRVLNCALGIAAFGLLVYGFTH